MGTSYLAQFQTRAVTNLKNYSTKMIKICENHERFHGKRENISATKNYLKFVAIFWIGRPYRQQPR